MLRSKGNKSEDNALGGQAKNPEVSDTLQPCTLAIGIEKQTGATWGSLQGDPLMQLEKNTCQVSCFTARGW